VASDPSHAETGIDSRTLAWRRYAMYACTNMMATPLDTVIFRNTRVFVKRDDLLESHGLSGSKARKFRALARPGALDGIACIVSFGGSQSNAMRSLAMFANRRDVQFIYYIARPVPQHVRRQKGGNFYDAMQAGMEIRHVSSEIYDRVFKENPLTSPLVFIRNDISHLSEDQFLYIPQGGAWPGAEDGIRELAYELDAQLRDMRELGRLTFPYTRPLVFLGSGTGTTALYLAKHLAHAARIVAVPVAGSSEYLVQQMRALDVTAATLEPSTGPSEFAGFPEVIRPRIRSTFADIRAEKLAMWRELERAGEGRIHFDLVYGPPAWEELWLALDEGRLQRDCDIVFLHTGGLEGNKSMLNRFTFKGLMTSYEFQDLNTNSESNSA
jgi:1-aminocyclopropane-1-carboxylate deaminase